MSGVVTTAARSLRRVRDRIVAAAHDRHALVVGALAAAMVLVLLPGVPAAVRTAVAVSFFLGAPGLAWVRALPVDGPVEQGAAVVAVSLAVDVIVAVALVHAGLVGATFFLTVVGIVVLGGLLVTTAADADLVAP